MEQCPSWEANSSSTSQEVKHILSNSKSLPLVPVLHQSEKSIHFNSISVKSFLILSSHLHPGLPTVLFPSSCPSEILYTFLFSPTHATWPAHLIHLDLSTQIIFGEEYKSYTSSLQTFPASVITSCFNPSISLCNLSSNTTAYDFPLTWEIKCRSH